MRSTVICELASSLDALANCERDLASGAGNDAFMTLRAEWKDKHAERVEWLCKNFLPSGSGVDCGTVLDMGASKPERLVFIMEYHAMSASGHYCGWHTYKLTVKPSLIHGFTVDCRSSSDTADYLCDILNHALSAEHERDALYPSHWARKPAAA